VHHDRVLHVAMTQARALRLISSDPVEDVSKPKVERQELEVLQLDEAAALLAAARSTRLFPIVLLALGRGLRRGEILARYGPGAASACVAQSLEQTKAGLRFKTPKTKRTRRTIALSIAEALQEHRAKQAADGLSPLGSAAILPGWCSPASTAIPSSRTA
jgi:integrase